MLNVAAVYALMDDCLIPAGGTATNAVVIDGVINKIPFDLARVIEKTPEIEALLLELPDEFHADKGGGMSFLNACNDRHGHQWTGLHATMEVLICLGIAAKKVRYCIDDRTIWAAFPGGMPYLMIAPKGVKFDS